MAGANKTNKQLPAKILLRSKYLSDWTASSYVLGSGEVGICTVPADTSLGETQPTYLMKVGDGTRTWNDLPYVTALAGDVYAWAKAATKPTYTADEISGLDKYQPPLVINFSNETTEYGQTTYTADKDFNTIAAAVNAGSEVIACVTPSNTSFSDKYFLPLQFYHSSTYMPVMTFAGFHSESNSMLVNNSNIDTHSLIYQELSIQGSGTTWVSVEYNYYDSAPINTILNSGLKNPNALTITTSDGNMVYDGSTAKSLTVPSVPTDILKYTTQTLTDDQKIQARTNIGITNEQISSWDAATKTFIAEFSESDTSTKVNMSTSLTDLKNAINNGYQVFAKFTRRGTTYMLPLAVYMVAASTTLARIAFSGAVNMAPINNSEPKTTIMTLISSDGGSTWTWWNVHGTNKYDIQSLEETGVKCPNALTIKLGDTTITYDGSGPQTVTINDESDKDLSQSLLNKLFPIGYIYLSTAATNPKDLFGGTWERLKDRFLLAAGDTYSAGATGGEATHKLTTAEMPSHTHSAAVNGGTVNYGKNRTTIGNFAINTKGYEDGSTIFPTGNGDAHNNMPPYLAVYMWKRTA